MGKHIGQSKNKELFCHFVVILFLSFGFVIWDLCCHVVVISLSFRCRLLCPLFELISDRVTG